MEIALAVALAAAALGLIFYLALENVMEIALAVALAAAALGLIFYLALENVMEIALAVALAAAALGLIFYLALRSGKPPQRGAGSGAPKLPSAPEKPRRGKDDL